MDTSLVPLSTCTNLPRRHAAAEPHNTLLYEALEYVDPPATDPPPRARAVRTFMACSLHLTPWSPARTSFDPVILSKFADPDLIITTLILSLRRRRGANTAHTQKLELRAPDGATPSPINKVHLQMQAQKSYSIAYPAAL